jgi:hypothetical protein
MHNFIRLAVILAVIVFLLVTATPALAKGNGGGPPVKGEYFVMPMLGGANNNEIHVPPGEPTVSIPTDNPAIRKDVLGGLGG